MGVGWREALAKRGRRAATRMMVLSPEIVTVNPRYSSTGLTLGEVVEFLDCLEYDDTLVTVADWIDFPRSV